MHTRFWLLLALLVTLLSLANSCDAQRPEKGKKKQPATLAASPSEVASKYYRVVGLGSASGDSSSTFPYPTAVLQLLDTVHTRVVVRFPELGMLGVREDTVSEPAFFIGDSLRGYEPPEPLLLLTFPKTQYFVLIDVWSRDRKTLLDSKPFEYDMDVQKYHTAHVSYTHEPTVGPGAPTLRRPFKPTLLPFTIETNPAWGATETLDSSGTYSLIFRDPERPKRLAMSISMRPALVGQVDSAMWKNFRLKAEMAFGARGVATNSIGDFQVDDVPSRTYIKGGYEFVSKTGDSTLDYVAAFLTPRAILMLFAPLDMPNEQLQYDYFRAVARSLKLE